MRRIIAILVVGLAACNPSEKNNDGGWDITLKGKIGYPGPGTIEIEEITEGGQGRKDTIQLKGNYTYEKTLHLKEPGFYRLSFYNRQFVTLILDKSDIEVNADGNSMSGFLQIKGSPDHDLLQRVQAMLQRGQTSPQAATLEKDFADAVQKNDQQRIQELRLKYEDLLLVSKDSVAAMLGQAPVSLAIVNLLMNENVVDRNRHFSLYTQVAERLAKEWPGNRYTSAFNDLVSKMKITAVGMEAPEIALPTPSGDTARLSSFRGKYVLVDFWAKWCGPCRRENPNLVKAYQKYKGKNFDVLGVSLDRTKEDWVQAIAEDGLTWTQVSDLKYFDSKAATDYNISAIPFSILVDPNGIIVAKDLRGLRLEKKLDEVLFK